jgi:Leucine-rich repeat (LRR) protein
MPRRSLTYRRAVLIVRQKSRKLMTIGVATSLHVTSRIPARVEASGLLDQKEKLSHTMLKRTGFLLAATYLLAGGLSVAHAAIPAIERTALIALYTSTNGVGWANRSGWKTPPLDVDGFAMPGTECDWFGVWCDVGETAVWAISTESNRLSGNIPPELGDLAGLTFLYLNNNQLSGGIPRELGSLSFLLDLSLHNNGLTGSIPVELQSLSSLENLWLHRNNLTGSIPPELGSISTLLELTLYDNGLTGSIPLELGYLSNLVTLWIDGNALTGSIPPDLGDLASLRALYLNGNLLSGVIPPDLRNLLSIEDLFLSANQLSGSIPPELGDLTTLRFLYLNNNQLTGGIPSDLGYLPDLQRLLLNENQLSGLIPRQLGNLDSLLYTYLDHNALSGPVPVELLSLTTLLNDRSNFCNNSLYTSSSTLSDFLDTKQIGGDWVSCQVGAVPTMSKTGILVMCALLAGSALWMLGRSKIVAK